MSNPKKPQRLSGERLGEIKRARRAFLAKDSKIGKRIDDLFDHISALTAELEERTRERDEALANSWAAQNPGEWIDKKAPADDR